jgi:hypothetical protein
MSACKEVGGREARGPDNFIIEIYKSFRKNYPLSIRVSGLSSPEDNETMTDRQVLEAKAQARLPAVRSVCL